MSYQVFSDMDGVLVNFEGGVLKFMNQRFQELKDQPDHPDHKLARSAAKEIGGWDVEIDKWHIARSDQEKSLPRNYRVRDFMYRLVENDVDLWANLEWERGGKELWNYIKDIPGVHNGKQGLLIDDRDKYVNEFRAGGGIAIKHNPDDVDNTIRQLQELGY